MADEDTGGTLHVVLVQCTNQKRAGTHAARDLYDKSDYFRKQRAYAKARADLWYIQSAKYGLLAPHEKAESYDKHAKDVDDTERWAVEIADRLEEDVPRTATVEILGGKAYVDPLTPVLERRGFEVHEPLRGQGIGERKASLIEKTNSTLEAFA